MWSFVFSLVSVLMAHRCYVFKSHYIVNILLLLFN